MVSSRGGLRHRGAASMSEDREGLLVDSGFTKESWNSSECYDSYVNWLKYGPDKFAFMVLRKSPHLKTAFKACSKDSWVTLPQKIRLLWHALDALDALDALISGSIPALAALAPEEKARITVLIESVLRKSLPYAAKFSPEELREAILQPLYELPAGTDAAVCEQIRTGFDW